MLAYRSLHKLLNFSEAITSKNQISGLVTRVRHACGTLRFYNQKPYTALGFFAVLYFPALVSFIYIEKIRMNKSHILVIEESLLAGLGNHGFDAHLCTTGVSGLDYAHQRSPTKPGAQEC